MQANCADTVAAAYQADNTQLELSKELVDPMLVLVRNRKSPGRISLRSIF
jgi:hypothetical protein